MTAQPYPPQNAPQGFHPTPEQWGVFAVLTGGEEVLLAPHRSKAHAMGHVNGLRDAVSNPTGENALIALPGVEGDFIVTSHIQRVRMRPVQG